MSRDVILMLLFVLAYYGHARLTDSANAITSGERFQAMSRYERLVLAQA